MEKLLTTPLVALAQGVYFLVTGVWPISSSRTFQKVTGPKADLWLVKTVGALIGVVGAVLVLAGLQREVSPQVGLLGMGSAASLGVSDVIYASRGRIRRIYLLDALAEAFLLAWWALARKSNSNHGE